MRHEIIFMGDDDQMSGTAAVRALIKIVDITPLKMRADGRASPGWPLASRDMDWQKLERAYLRGKNILMIPTA